MVVRGPHAEVRRLLGVHDPLGIRFRARREDELRHVARAAGRGRPCAGSGGVAGEDDVELRAVRRAALADQHVHGRVIETRAHGVDHAHVVEGTVLDRREQHARSRRTQDVGELLLPVIRDQRVHHRARAQRAERDGDRLHPVRKLHRHDVARRDAGVDQERSDARRPRVELAEGRATRAVAVDHRDVVGSRRDQRVDPLDQRGLVPEAARLVALPAPVAGDDVDEILRAHGAGSSTTKRSSVHSAWST